MLVAYGSERGGTEGLARALADALRALGVPTYVSDATDVADVGRYDAVIVGGALYAGRWHRNARRFVKRLMKDVRARGHATFGGRLTADAKGFIASKMARTRAGDWRDPMQIHDWARQIASSLTAAAPTAHAPAP